MDAGKIFVIILTSIAVASIVYLEVISRRSKNKAEGTPEESRNNGGKSSRKQ